MESYDYHGQENFDNPNSVVARSYTFGEPLELVVDRLIARVEALEAIVANQEVIVSFDGLICDDCPGGADCCQYDDEA